MAYEKNTWATGDVVTSTKLNHMEDGIASGGLPIIPTTWTSEQSFTFEKTYAEVKAILDSGTIALFEMAIELQDVSLKTYGVVTGYAEQGGTYSLSILGEHQISVASPDAYPVYSIA